MIGIYQWTNQLKGNAAKLHCRCMTVDHSLHPDEEHGGKPRGTSPPEWRICGT